MENETALHWAALLGHLPSAQLLVARGATSFKNKRGEAPLHVAELAGYLEVAACLRDAERHEAERGHAPLPVRVHTWAGCMCFPSTLTVSLCELAWVGNFHDFRLGSHEYYVVLVTSYFRYLASAPKTLTLSPTPQSHLPRLYLSPPPSLSLYLRKGRWDLALSLGLPH